MFFTCKNFVPILRGKKIFAPGNGGGGGKRGGGTGVPPVPFPYGPVAKCFLLLHIFTYISFLYTCISEKKAFSV